MAADFDLDLIEEQHDSCWVSFVAKRPVGKGSESYPLQIEFEECTFEELEALQDNEEDDRDLILRKARNWKGFKVKGEDGKLVEVPFDTDRLAKLLNRIWFLRAASEAFQERMASIGKKRSRQRGN